MTSQLSEEINTYTAHFQEQHQAIQASHGPRLHRKLLVVSMLGALAEGRYANISGDRKKFLNLIEEYGNWPHAKRISISQLQMRLGELSSPSSKFSNEVNRLYSNWSGTRHPSEIVNLDGEPDVQLLLQSCSTNEEKKLVDQTKHSSLLYKYRSILVHEFREPGGGFELSSDGQQPYYHSCLDGDTGRSTTELVYPADWFINLPTSIIPRLQEYYLSSNINPYDSYSFGSPWYSNA